MPYTMADFRRDSKRFLINQVKDNLDTVLEELSPEIVKRLTPEQRLNGLSPEEFLKRLPIDELEAYLAKVKQPKKAGRRKVSEK